MLHRLSKFSAGTHGQLLSAPEFHCIANMRGATEQAIQSGGDLPHVVALIWTEGIVTGTLRTQLGTVRLAGMLCCMQCGGEYQTKVLNW